MSGRGALDGQAIAGQVKGALDGRGAGLVQADVQKAATGLQRRAQRARTAHAQDGSDFQAGTPITSCSADAASGCCTAYMTRALTGSTSAAKVSYLSADAAAESGLDEVEQVGVEGVLVGGGLGQAVRGAGIDLQGRVLDDLR